MNGFTQCIINLLLLLLYYHDCSACVVLGRYNDIDISVMQLSRPPSYYLGCWTQTQQYNWTIQLKTIKKIQFPSSFQKLFNSFESYIFQITAFICKCCHNKKTFVVRLKCEFKIMSVDFNRYLSQDQQCVPNTGSLRVSSLIANCFIVSNANFGCFKF